MYMTEPVAGLGGRRSYWPRGKVLGVSSSINAMVYIRGQAADYEGWKAAGNHGWGWDDILPLYRRMECHAGGPRAHHRGRGPPHVRATQGGASPTCEVFQAP